MDYAVIVELKESIEADALGSLLRSSFSTGEKGCFLVFAILGIGLTMIC